MARIEGISDKRAPFWLKILYWFSRRTATKLTGTKSGTMEPLKIMAHRRWIMFADGFFETALQRSNSADFKLKELARMKASSLAGCPW